MALRSVCSSFRKFSLLTWISRDSEVIQVHPVRDPIQFTSQASLTFHLAQSHLNSLGNMHDRRRPRPYLWSTPRHAAPHRAFRSRLLARLHLSHFHVLSTLRAAMAYLFILRSLYHLRCFWRPLRLRTEPHARLRRLCRLALDIHYRGHLDRRGSHCCKIRYCRLP